MYQGVVVDRWSAVFEATMRAGRESGGKARRRLRAKSQLTSSGHAILKDHRVCRAEECSESNICNRVLKIVAALLENCSMFKNVYEISGLCYPRREVTRALACLRTQDTHSGDRGCRQVYLVQTRPPAPSSSKRTVPSCILGRFWRASTLMLREAVFEGLLQ